MEHGVTFVEWFSQLMDKMHGIVWGPVLIVLLVGTGLYLTIRLRFVQLRYVKHAVMCITGKYDNPAEKGDVSHFDALCAALAATIGTGNIAGVATAIALGGPGAVFWMWVTATVGMAAKFTSCSLSLRFRDVHSDGSVSGGPMYYLQKGLNLKWLGVIFAICAGVASFGMGCMVQANSVREGLVSVLPEKWGAVHLDSISPSLGTTPVINVVIGLILAFMVGIVIIGGIKRIANVASRVVPFMCVLYVTSALVILFFNYKEIPSGFACIFRYAFTPLAAGGGFVGFVMARTIQNGVARGIFSNESGLGSAPIAHAAAKTHEMIREGFVAMLEPLIDTLIICTMTALVIITSGVWQVKADDGKTVLYGPDGKGLPMKYMVNGEQKDVVGTIGDDPNPILNESDEPYVIPTGAAMTASAFQKSIAEVFEGSRFEQHFKNIGAWIVSISLVFFAYTTMISWSYYGDRCWEFLLGGKVVVPYRYLFCVFVFIGSIAQLNLVWTIADNLNALMAVPNLIGLIGLVGLVSKESKDYLRRMREIHDI